MSYYIRTKRSTNETQVDLRETFRKWGVSDWDVTFNVQRARLRNRGLTRSERAVTVRWIVPTSDREIVLMSDDQATVADNIRKLYLGIEAMRLNDARGLSEIMQAAYLQLPAPASEPSNAYAVLGITRWEGEAEARHAFRERARSAHPDAGGSHDEMVAVNAAWAEICRERGW